MKEEFGMSYRKLKHVSVHSNSEKNLVLRQQWALQMLEHTLDNKIFLNIDETWLGMSDFRRMKWRVKNTTNSYPSVQLTPRISMIIGIDTKGSIYLTLT